MPKSRNAEVRLEQFLKDLLEPMGRSERRHWGAVCIRGLLLNGERKSIKSRLRRSLGRRGNVQALQQFVGQSPWDCVPYSERLSNRMTAQMQPDPVWEIDETRFPKQGKHSVGVERQYSGTLGKVGNCQVAAQPAPCWRTRQHGARLASVSAGKLDEGR